jgi:hypothetical protein
MPLCTAIAVQLMVLCAPNSSAFELDPGRQLYLKDPAVNFCFIFELFRLMYTNSIAHVQLGQLTVTFNLPLIEIGDK